MKRAGLALLCLSLLVPSCAQQPQEENVDDYMVELQPGELGLVQLPAGEPWPDFSIGWPIREELLQSTDYSLTYLSKPSAKGFFP